jgi:phosphohistidine phosphatase
VLFFIMRHGPAEDDSPTGRDADRALTASGRERVEAVARSLAAEGELPARILTSSLVRAVQTADIVASAARGEGWQGTPEVVGELIPGGDVVSLIHRLAETGEGPIMLVGHEPTLSCSVADLLGEPSPLAMKKAMVVALKLGHQGRARLRFILDPKTLAYQYDDRRGHGHRD